MSEFNDIEFQVDGINFNIDIGDRVQSFYLSISLLELLSGKKIINGKPVALTIFHQYRQTIYKMAINALRKNPGWSEEKPFVLNKSYLDS